MVWEVNYTLKYQPICEQVTATKMGDYVAEVYSGGRLVKNLPPHCKWEPQTQGSSLLDSLLVATLGVCKSWEVSMDLGLDPTEG